MPMQLSDATAGVQRVQFANNGNTEFGSATPSSSLSFQGRPLLDGSYLAQNVARPDGMPRYTGSLTIPAYTSVTVNCPTCAGFGSVDGNGAVCSFNSDRTQFVVGSGGVYYPIDGDSVTVSYSVF